MAALVTPNQPHDYERLSSIMSEVGLLTGTNSIKVKTNKRVSELGLSRHHSSKRRTVA